MVAPKSPSVSLAAQEGGAPANTCPPRRSGERRIQPPAWLAPCAIASLVMQRHARLSYFNHFEVLDIPENADSETIRRAFQQAVRRFHPGQLVGEYEPLQPLAKEIVCRIGVAYRILEDDAARAQYRRSLAEYPHLSAVRSSMPSPRPSRAALRKSGEVDAAGPWTAAKAFAAAQLHLRRGALDEALAQIERACIAQPEQPEYRALHAWLRVERGELTDGPIAEEILMTLTWAVRQRRDDLDIRMYRGRVLQRLGRNDEAMREFSVVASMDATNLEALREVQLQRAREEHKAAPGLWHPLPKES